MIETNEILRETAEHLARQHDYDNYTDYVREVEMIYNDLLSRKERLDKKHEV